MIRVLDVAAAAAAALGFAYLWVRLLIFVIRMGKEERIR